MANELIYVKFDYYESLESKRNVLSSEMSLLNIMKAMKKYNVLRQEEMRKKEQMLKLIKQLEATLKKSKASLPLPRTPEKTKKGSKEESKSAKAIKTFDDDLENQLREIQERLRAIGG